jgi:hypothetical protein
MEMGVELGRYEKVRKLRVEKLSETMKRERKERERGHWKMWLFEWAFWGFLKVANVFGSRWSKDTFGYDPDLIFYLDVLGIKCSTKNC